MPIGTAPPGVPRPCDRRAALLSITAIVAVAGQTACQPAAPGSAAAAPPERIVASVQAAIDTELAAIGTDGPGLLIAVVSGDRVLGKGARGLADVSTRAALGDDSQMRIASLTKQFVAVALLQLVEQGRIGLDDPVSRYVPALSKAAAGATVRSLLNHTSGLADHGDLFINHERVAYDEDEPGGYLFAPAGSRPGEYMPTGADVIAILAEFPTQRFETGTRWEYSNSAYIVLAQIVESVSGQRFRDYARDHLFEPLGMSDSGVLDERRPTLDRPTASYVRVDDGFSERDYSPFNQLYGDGGIYSSLRDLIAWRRALPPDVLVSLESLEEIHRPARLSDGNVITDTPRGAGYGMGWFIDSIDGEPVYLHGGWVGVRHAIYHAPVAGVWVVVLSNRADTHPYEIAERLMRTTLADLASKTA